MQKHIQHNKDERHSSLEKYTSHFIRKGSVWEGVGDWTKTATYWPPSSSSVSFSFFWVAQPEARGPSSLLSAVLSTVSFLHMTEFRSSPELYNNLTFTFLPACVTISHSFNPSTVKVIISWYSSTGCTCYLHRCISYFDSLAGSEVNIQQDERERFSKYSSAEEISSKK